jgi:hypothetical protein
MDWTAQLVNVAVLGLPPLSCICAWWLWARERRSGYLSIPRWRRITTIIDLVVFTLSIAVGAFALLYWWDFSREPLPPALTRMATLLGFALASFGMPFSLMAKSWNRVALVVCSLTLLVFYIAMFAAA